jgi:hypothetical protein
MGRFNLAPLVIPAGSLLTWALIIRAVCLLTGAH